MSKIPDTETEVRNLQSLVTKMSFVPNHRQQSSVESSDSLISSPSSSLNNSSHQDPIDNQSVVSSVKTFFRSGSKRSIKRSFIVPETTVNQDKSAKSSASKNAIDQQLTRDDSLESDVFGNGDPLVMHCDSEPLNERAFSKVETIQNDELTSSDCDEPVQSSSRSTKVHNSHQANNHNLHQSGAPKSFYLAPPPTNKESEVIAKVGPTLVSSHQSAVNNNVQKGESQSKRRPSKSERSSKTQSSNDDESWLMKIPKLNNKSDESISKLTPLQWMREVFDSELLDMKHAKLLLLMRLQEIERSQRLYGQGSQPNLFNLQPFSVSNEPSRRYSRPLTGDYSMSSFNPPSSKSMQTTSSQTDLHGLDSQQPDQPQSLQNKASSSDNLTKGFRGSHERLNDISDVRNMARMQEEQLKAHVMERRRSRTDLTAGQVSRKQSVQNDASNSSCDQLTAPKPSNPVQRSNSSSNSDIDKKAFQSNSLASRSNLLNPKTASGIPHRASSISGNVKHQLNRSRSSQNVSTMDPTRRSTDELNGPYSRASSGEYLASSGENVSTYRNSGGVQRSSKLQKPRRTTSGENLAVDRAGPAERRLAPRRSVEVSNVQRTRSFNSLHGSNPQRMAVNKSSEEDLPSRSGSNLRRSQARSPHRTSSDVPVAPPRQMRTVKKLDSDKQEGRRHPPPQKNNSQTSGRNYATVQYYEEDF